MGLAKAGADVAITSVPGDNALNEVAREIEDVERRCVCLFYDIADPEAARQGVCDAARQLGTVDVLVNNARPATFLLANSRLDRRHMNPADTSAAATPKPSNICLD